jgi:8-hydroxy-5-deazaflavin:NADPH oxidoreductase
VRQPEASGDRVTKTVGGGIEGTEIVILATRWTAAQALVCEHAPALAGKIVIDATNPLNASGTRLALGFDTSGVELLQSDATAPHFQGVQRRRRRRHRQAVSSVVMFVAGPKGEQKDIVLRIMADAGFEPALGNVADAA